MPTPSTPVPFDELLRHQEWLRRLAGRLLVDEAAADDAVQQTWLAALTSRPRAGAPVKGWLATVLRNAARKRHRETTRRDARERAVAVGEREGDTAETVERFEQQRLLVQEVAALDEPYRTTVLLRFFEDLPPREIATRLDVPVKTVETRLYRAQRKLRERMDALHGGNREAWCAPLAPWALGASGSGGAATASALAPFGGVAVMSIAKFAVIAALAVATWTAFGPGSDEGRVEPSGPTDRVSAGAPLRPGGAAADVEREAVADAGRAEIDAAPPPPARPAPGARPEDPLVIRIADDRGGPARRVRVALVRDGSVVAQGQTNDRGEVSFEPIAGLLDCAVTGGAVWPSLHRVDGAAGEHTIRLPSGAPLGGSVRIDGAAPGRRVRIIFDVDARSARDLALPPDVWTALGEPGRAPEALFVDSEVDGSFRFVGLPPQLTGRLRLFDRGLARADGETGHHRVDRLRADFDLRYTALPRLAGRLLDHEGTPVDHGMVRAVVTTRDRIGSGSYGEFTNDEGRFEFQLAAADVVEVRLLGRNDVGGARSIFTFAGPFEQRHDLGDLRLETPRSITLRVVGPDGRPLSGAHAYVTGGWDSTSEPSRSDGRIRMEISPLVERLLVTAVGYDVRAVAVRALGGREIDVSLTRTTLVDVRLETEGSFPPKAVFVHVESEGQLFDEVEDLFETPGEQATAQGMHRGGDGSGAAYSFAKDGHCRIRRLPAGVPFDLVVTGKLGVELARHHVVLAPSERREIVVAVGRRRPVTGVVLDPAGRPLGKARVVISHEGDDTGYFFTKSDGRFAFPDLLASRVTFLVERAGYAPVHLVDLVVPDGGLEREVRMEPSRDVEVVLVDEAGAPVDGVEVMALVPGTEIEAEPTAGGRATLHDLPRAPVTVRFEDAGVVVERAIDATSTEETFVVATAGSVVARWELAVERTRFGELHLTPVGADGAAVVNEDVDFSKVEPRGSATIARVVPGRYAVTLEMWNADWEARAVVKRGTVVVEAGKVAAVVWE